MRYIYRKYIRPNQNATTGPWKWFFRTKDILQSASSVGSLALDRLFFAIKDNEIKPLYEQNDSIDFEVNCINLLRRSDKKKFIEKQFKETDFTLRMFPAVDGLTINPSQLIKNGMLSPNNHNQSTGKPLSPAQIGVYLSHYELWKATLASPNKGSLILEDDALMTCDKATLEEFLRHIPEDTDLFFINRRKNKTKHISLHASKFVRRFWGLTAYFLTKQGAEKLLLSALPIRKSVDDTISELNGKGMINCYCSRKELVVECSNPKDKKNFRFSSDILNRKQK